MKKALIIVSVLVLIIVVVIIKVSFRDADISVKSDKTELKITASDLLQEFSLDENAANKKYLNKVIEVTGRISKVEDTEEGFNVYLQDQDQLSGVICGFNPKAANKYDFVIDETVTIKGLCTGYLFDVILVKCVLMD